MSTERNDLEEFIYKICYNSIWASVAEYIALHPTILNLTFSRVKYPDTALLEDMMLEYTSNIRIDEDKLIFDAIISCTIELQQNDEYRGTISGESSQWLIASCEATITDRLDKLVITDVKPWVKNRKPITSGIAVSKSIVPILKKENLEAEATAFLKRYCAEALETPMPVPIEKIATEDLHLTVLQGHRITNDFSVLGQICFSKGTVVVQDIFRCSEQEMEVSRGTILIDAYTYMDRNIGAVNNTLAHEVYHWHRHRLYAAIKQILRDEKFIAHRCPVNMSYPQENEEWTDEQRMEWQANNLAPRILMPYDSFRKKVDELYEKYAFKNTDLKIAVLTCIADELAKFFIVSRQSALIRMTETGYPEARMVLQQMDEDGMHSYISLEDVFYEYSNNKEFRHLLDSGKFRYVEGYVIINDDKYIQLHEDGKPFLTEYAWNNLTECTLAFSIQRIKRSAAKGQLPNSILHRANDEQEVSKYEKKNNEAVLQCSEEIQKKRREFEQQQAIRRMHSPVKSCYEAMYEIIQAKGISKSHFCNLTMLGEEVYRKAEKSNTSKPGTRAITAFAVGLNLDIDTTEYLMKLAGRTFSDDDEDQALRFCVTGLSGHSIDECNDFLTSYGYEPLGTKERY